MGEEMVGLEGEVSEGVRADLRAFHIFLGWYGIWIRMVSWTGEERLD